MMLLYPHFPDPDEVAPVPCPVPGCTASLRYEGSSVVIGSGGHTTDFGKRAHLLSHDGEPGHTLLVTTWDALEDTLDRLTGTVDETALGWVE